MVLLVLSIIVGILHCADENNNNNTPENNAASLFSKSSSFKLHPECQYHKLFSLKAKSMQALEDQVCFLEIKDSDKPRLLCHRYGIADDSMELRHISSYSFPVYPPLHQIKSYDFEFVNQPSTNAIIFKLLSHSDEATYHSWNIIYPTNEICTITEGGLTQAKAIITDPKKNNILYALIIKDKKNKKAIFLKRCRYHAKTNKLTSFSLLKNEGENIDVFERFQNSFIINKDYILKFAYVLNNKIHTFSYNLTTKDKETCIYPEKVTDVFFGYDAKIKHFVRLHDAKHQVIIQHANTVDAQFNINFDPSSRLILSTTGTLGAVFFNNEFLLIIDLLSQEVIGYSEIELHEACYNCRFIHANNFFLFEHGEKFYLCDLRSLKTIS